MLFLRDDTRRKRVSGSDGRLPGRLRVSPTSSPRSYCRGGQRRPRSRRAAVLIAVVICVAVASLILVSVVKTATAHRGLLQTQSRQVSYISLKPCAC